jgi:hypothetical protein
MHRALVLFLAAGCGNAGGFRNDAGPTDRGGNDNGGSFEERVIDDSIVHGQGAEIVDIDADGDNDVVVALSLTDAVYLYVNEGGGTTWSTVQVGPPNTIVGIQVAVADFDGDSDLDIAAVGLFLRSGGPGEITWYENPGNVTGAWTERPITGDAFDGPIYLDTGDLNGDGRPDLLVGANEPGRGVWWLENEGGSFGAPIPIDSDLADARSVQAADVDADGDDDVVAAGRISGELAWYRNDAAVFTKSRIAAVENPSDVQVANLDGDAALEVVAVMAGNISWFDPPSWTRNDVATFPSSDTSRIVARDLDGDGTIDVAASTTEAGGELRLHTNAGGSFTTEVVRSGYAGLNYVVGGDVDGDGREDLLTTTYSHTDSSDLISWWANAR